MKKRLPHASMFSWTGEGLEKAAFLQEGDKSGGSASQIWMVTFADLVSLLLTFFIMLYAMSSISMEKWDKVTDNKELNRSEAAESSEGVSGTRYALADLLYRRAVELHYLQAVLEEAMKGDGTLQGARVKLQDDRLVVSLPVDFLFASTETRIASQGEKVLFSLGGVLRSISNKINVVSYSTFSRTLQEGAASWELSLARASAVADSLRKSGYSQEIGIVSAMDGSDATSVSDPVAANRMTIVILSRLAGG